MIAPYIEGCTSAGVGAPFMKCRSSSRLGRTLGGLLRASGQDKSNGRENTTYLFNVSLFLAGYEAAQAGCVDRAG
jgi:hypothetical protein